MEISNIEKAIEKKKKFLKRYKKNLACIDRLKVKLQTLDEKIKRVKSPNYSGMPRGSLPVTIDDLLSDKSDLENRIEKLKAKKSNLKRAVVDEIDTLEDERYVEVLESFFIDCKSFEDIAEDTGYQERHVVRLYSQGILELVNNDMVSQ